MIEPNRILVQRWARAQRRSERSGQHGEFLKRYANTRMVITAFVAIAGVLFLWLSKIGLFQIAYQPIVIRLIIADLCVLIYFAIDNNAGKTDNNSRYVILVLGYVFYIVGFVLSVRLAYSFCQLLSVPMKIWDKAWDFLVPSQYASFAEKIKSIAWLRTGATLLSGCLLILSWSNKQFFETWNPFTMFELGSSKAGAPQIIAMLAIVLGAEIAGAYRLALVALIFLLAFNVASAYFGYLFVTQKLVSALLVRRIVSKLDPTHQKVKDFCRELDKVTMTIWGGIRKKGILEQSRRQREILDGTAVALQKKSGAYYTQEIGLALGYSSVPHSLTKDMSPEYVTEMVEQHFKHYRNTNSNLSDETELRFRAAVLSGLLLGLVALIISKKRSSSPLDVILDYSAHNAQDRYARLLMTIATMENGLYMTPERPTSFYRPAHDCLADMVAEDSWKGHLPISDPREKMWFSERIRREVNWPQLQVMFKQSME